MPWFNNVPTPCVEARLHIGKELASRLHLPFFFSPLRKQAERLITQRKHRVVSIFQKQNTCLCITVCMIVVRCCASLRSLHPGSSLTRLPKCTGILPNIGPAPCHLNEPSFPFRPVRQSGAPQAYDMGKPEWMGQLLSSIAHCGEEDGTVHSAGVQRGTAQFTGQVCSGEVYSVGAGRGLRRPLPIACGVTGTAFGYSAA